MVWKNSKNKKKMGSKGRAWYAHSTQNAPTATVVSVVDVILRRDGRPVVSTSLHGIAALAIGCQRWLVGIRSSYHIELMTCSRKHDE